MLKGMGHDGAQDTTKLASLAETKRKIAGKEGTQTWVLARRSRGTAETGHRCPLLPGAPAAGQGSSLHHGEDRVQARRTWVCV
ncbi:uncharacterized protein CTRU02_207077 [Colletotrichum truncatum]|uniref:Uncharacterized protein n=1 Tax=Colletotrichum truncatum TaxID=5467 RepID=A0ACC3YZI8_COLTU|nr:uncharacterized protein CTRU02_11060 [Colletotrichum truncatum]KAF6786189.1 hypothetical protein CTRU02_11060 [Colletotrichum truncatum]